VRCLPSVPDSRAAMAMVTGMMFPTGLSSGLQELAATINDPRVDTKKLVAEVRGCGRLHMCILGLRLCSRSQCLYMQ